ncbi:hypothetical protein FFWV33_13790 [Flavobacterium faecale]|uniref:VWA domain-containing protein n=1 Tax=Flavobacterium faecale TaxID=1355330 RepID=A0A2S1LFU5_9FLAO|nr:hypothetical protein [Flavobacterium faecale]AWG22521.1 hypothetical protein FFWV33_13790 [Flavobacterium faecale]
MTAATILLLILSLLLAGGLSFFQYIYKAKSKSKLNLFLAFIRFLSLFGLFLLLINPVITTSKLEIEKPAFAIVIDNSSSIAVLNARQTAKDLFSFFKESKELNDKFEVQTYQFDKEFSATTTLDFKGSQTNFDGIAKNLKNYNRNQIYPTVVITDGNQTAGSDYTYSFSDTNKIFPVVVGDTIKVFDLKIAQLNVNKYAFLKNKFPVEIFLSYSGDKNCSAEVSISNGKSIIAKQSVSFSPENTSQTISLLLPADRVGLMVYKATISSIEREKNTYNNSKNFAVEVLDQKTNIALVSSISHPDIAAFKRAIESNKQRKVTIVKHNDIKSLADYSVCVLYQPNSSFKTLFDLIKKARINSWIVTGTHTDFMFLNQNQNLFDFKMSGQPEEFTASFQSQFNQFAAEDIGFDALPPLENPFGTITTKAVVSNLLTSKIRNIDTKAPLLTFVENQGIRSAFLFGENSWRWRLDTHVKDQSFEKYDLFIDKIIQFLASNNSKKSLVVSHENFYNSGESIEMTAQFFNKNYEFDEKAHLTIAVKNTKTKEVKNYDFLRSNNAFKVNLDGLSPGTYTFSVKELNTNSSYSNSFEILDFDIEKQFVNADAEKLSQLALKTGGKLYFPNQKENLVQLLLNDQDYKAIQKKVTSKSPIIEWYWLLLLISLFLSTEWFVRKYNGLL